MAFFYEEGEEKKRSGVFMRHVNIGTIAEDEDGNGSYAPSRIFIDPTLTQEGEAAEAKATGDAINALEEQTNQALDELSENTETAISDLQDATEEAINSLAAIGVIEDTKSGEVVSISDSAAYKMQGLRLYGKSRQATTTGAQLLNFNFGNFYTDADGTIVTGNSYKSFLLLLRKNESIYISGDFTLLNNGTIRVGTFDQIPELGEVGTRSNIAFSKSITTDKDIYIVFSFIPDDSTPSTLDQHFAEILNSFMINHGDSALPWEPYTGGKPSPSPEYPQEIESAGDGGDIATQIMGANLFDVSKNILPKPVTFSISIESENTFTVTALKEGNGLEFYIRVPIDVPVGTTVSISGQSSDGYQFNLLNRQIDGSLAVGELTGKTMARKEGLRLFAVCNPFGGSTINVSEGQTVTCTDVTVSIGSTALPWEPYKSQTLTYPTLSGLPGIPVESGGNYTDAEGQEWVCDEVDFARGKYVQRINHITLTSNMGWDPNLTWDQQAPDIFHFYVNITDKKVDTQNGANNTLCTHFECKTVGGSSLINTECIYSLYTNQTIYVFLAKSRASTPDLEGFKGWIDQNQPVIYYILQNPIENDLSPEQITAYAALTTYKPNTTITTDSDPAAGIGVDYIADTKAYIDNKFAQLAELSTVVNALIGADE